MLLLVLKLIASNRCVFDSPLHYLINIIFIFRTQVIKPIKIFQRFLFRLQIGDGGKTSLRTGPYLQPFQRIVFHPNCQESALGFIQTDHRAVIQRIEDGFRIPFDIDLPDSLTFKICFQVIPFQLIIISRIEMLHCKCILYHMCIICLLYTSPSPRD